MFKLLVVGAVVAALVVVYKLWKAKKAVTGAAVVAGVKDEVKAAVDAVKSDVSKS